ncbi:hypothetical protein GGR56DRAFT_628085 [Xylariaceae sp. FL0804]|nr:hypothetical protein GGR56DRAFT_628085 [Xylariaceae sp. FL0804]
MSWASNRQTTRVEDMAYCLLGIFDINMPLLYGEGKKAFIRLQEEIIKSSNDLSIFAWTADLEDGRAFRGLWASCPAEFTSCQSLVRPSFEWNGRGEYSITSRGLRTTDMIRVGRGSSSRAGNYFMPLNCVDARNMKHLRFVSLRQYGPSLFVRRKPWLYDTFVDVDVYMASRLAEPQYICCRETPDLESLVRSSREDSIQIRFDEELFDGATVRTCPEADWDSRNAILLTYRRRHFWGMWKIRMAEGRGQEKQQQQQQLEQQSEQRPEGVCVVCVFSNGFLLFGIFTLHDLPLAFERSDLLPSQAEEILEEIPDRTSTRCAGWAHKIVEAAVDLAEEGDPVKIPGTMLQISSTRADDSQKGGNRVRRRIKQLLKKSTWPRGSASPQALPTKGTWPQ